MPFRDAGRGTGDGATPLPTRIARVVRRIIGAPDYGAYLEHCRLAGHPPHLDERAYLSDFFASRGKGVRCC